METTLCYVLEVGGLDGFLSSRDHIPKIYDLDFLEIKSDQVVFWFQGLFIDLEDWFDCAFPSDMLQCIFLAILLVSFRGLGALHHI